jgi:single-strand DNA-binding protein
LGTEHEILAVNKKGTIMAKSVNKVILLGNVGKDPEMRSTGGGTLVANFTLATSDRSKDAQGNWQDRTEWHNLVAFTRLAEIVRDYVKKGSKLYIEGKIQTRSWDDKETGAKRYRTEILVNDLSLLSGRDEGSSTVRAPPTRRQTSISALPPDTTTSRSKPKSPTTIFPFRKACWSLCAFTQRRRESKASSRLFFAFAPRQCKITTLLGCSPFVFPVRQCLIDSVHRVAGIGFASLPDKIAKIITDEQSDA